MDLFFTKAYATACTTLNCYIGRVDSIIINPLIEFLFALAVVYFLYGVFEFFTNQDNDEKKTTGKSHMLWGIIGITIMLGVFTILGIIVRTFNLQDDVDPATSTVDLGS